jgi:hypothetical protein
MYQPYPSSGQPAEPLRPPAPAPVLTAVKHRRRRLGRRGRADGPRQGLIKAMPGPAARSFWPTVRKPAMYQAPRAPRQRPSNPDDQRNDRSLRSRRLANPPP